MKCISCDSEINPKWKHAIEQNSCPYCGQHIMDENLKSLLSVLTDAMERMQEYPDQLNDWMLFNYNFILSYSNYFRNYSRKKGKQKYRQLFFRRSQNALVATRSIGNGIKHRFSRDNVDCRFSI